MYHIDISTKECHITLILHVYDLTLISGGGGDGGGFTGEKAVMSLTQDWGVCTRDTPEYVEEDLRTCLAELVVTKKDILSKN